jgi:C-terminal processing protease CtpA/Prc
MCMRGCPIHHGMPFDVRQVNPVFSTAFRHNSAAGPEVTGYIRLVNFNMHAAMDVKHAITELQVNDSATW